MVLVTQEDDIPPLQVKDHNDIPESINGDEPGDVAEVVPLRRSKRVRKSPISDDFVVYL